MDVPPDCRVSIGRHWVPCQDPRWLTRRRALGPARPAPMNCVDTYRGYASLWTRRPYLGMSAHSPRQILDVQPTCTDSTTRSSP